MKQSYELLKKIVEIKTVNDNETEISKFLYDYLKNDADKIELIGNENRKNIIAYFGNLNSKNILLFNGHLDTVSAPEKDWKYNPFILQRIGDVAYGRGTADMKGGIVISIIAIIQAKKENLLNDKLIIFAGSADEETGADSEFGCKMIVEHLIKNKLIPTGAIIPEPNTHNDKIKINLGHRGLLWIQCEAKGISMHSGLLRKENNAILNMYSFISKVYELFPNNPTKTNGIPPSSCRITYISSGINQGFKRTPENCIADLDIRISPIECNLDVLNKIENLSKQYNISIKIIKNTPSACIKDSEKVVKVITDVLNEQKIDFKLGYASPTCDAHWFISKGIPCINGMGATGDNPHAPNEFIYLSSIDERIQTFKKIIEKY